MPSQPSIPVIKNTPGHQTTCRLFVAPVEEISAITQTTDKFHRSVTFASGKTWTEIYYTPGTGELVEKYKETDAGALWEQSLKVSFPTDAASGTLQLDPFVDRPIVVKIDMSCGTSRLIGDLANPARMAINFKMGGKEAAGRTLEFTCSAISQMRYYSA